MDQLADGCERATSVVVHERVAGDVTGSVTPSAAAYARTNVVLPAPSPPTKTTTAPGAATPARRAAITPVAAGEDVVRLARLVIGCGQRELTRTRSARICATTTPPPRSA